MYDSQQLRAQHESFLSPTACPDSGLCGLRTLSVATLWLSTKYSHLSSPSVKHFRQSWEEHRCISTTATVVSQTSNPPSLTLVDVLFATVLLIVCINIDLFYPFHPRRSDMSGGHVLCPSYEVDERSAQFRAGQVTPKRGYMKVRETDVHVLPKQIRVMLDVVACT